MLYDRILIRYGELSLKGRNKKRFLDKIFITIKHKCNKFKSLDYIRFHDRMFIILNGEDPYAVIQKLNQVFGLYSYSLCARCESNIEDIKKLAKEVVKNEITSKTTFKVETKRADKSFPIQSLEVSKKVASYVLKDNSERLIVDVHKPKVILKVDITFDGTYIYTNKIKGLGGLPIGIDGKGLLMLSGGIDSPVAGFLVQKRGVEIEVIHYASPPYTSDKSKQKVFDLTEKLSYYSAFGKVKLHVVPFTKIQKSIYDNCPNSYAITIMRRMMYRIAEKLAYKNDCLIIANGESLGQVASQTLYSMNAINSVTNIPVIRPVATMDKDEIVSLAKKIDTYEISIRPYEDCCTIFVPKNPVTKPNIRKCISFEKSFDYESLIDECINNIETIEIEEGKNIELENSCVIDDLF